MSLLSYILPRVILKTSSVYNRDIRVIEEQGKLKLLVNGSRQSGSYVERLWKKAFGAFRLGSFKSILVFGIGGGTVIHLLHKKYPKAAITAVDIDPMMIDIGKKYFGLSQIPNLKLIVADAKDYKITRRYDLVIIDLFIGRHIPKFVGDEDFLRRFRASTVIINYLRELEYKEKSQKLQSMLAKIFPIVKNYQIERNSFFLVASKKSDFVVE